jgi:hypothetical protein
MSGSDSTRSSRSGCMKRSRTTSPPAKSSPINIRRSRARRAGKTLTSSSVAPVPTATAMMTEQPQIVGEKEHRQRGDDAAERQEREERQEQPRQSEPEQVVAELRVLRELPGDPEGSCQQRATQQQQVWEWPAGCLTRGRRGDAAGASVRQLRRSPAAPSRPSASGTPASARHRRSPPARGDRRPSRAR